MPKVKNGFIGEQAIVFPASIIKDFKNTDLGYLLYITKIGYYPNANHHLLHYRRRVV